MLKSTEKNQLRKFALRSKTTSKIAGFKRDNRSPEPLNESVSHVMSANKAKDTTPEIGFRRALWTQGLRGYRLHYKKLPGRPDICFVGKRLAIFVNGCFWHRCQKCQFPLPKNNSKFWVAKFNANVARDLKKVRLLEELGWKVLTVWECDITRDPLSATRPVQELLLR